MSSLFLCFYFFYFLFFEIVRIYDCNIFWSLILFANGILFDIIVLLWYFVRPQKFHEHMLESHLDHLVVFLSKHPVISGRISSSFLILLWVNYVEIMYVTFNISFFNISCLLRYMLLIIYKISIVTTFLFIFIIIISNHRTWIWLVA